MMLAHGRRVLACVLVTVLLGPAAAAAAETPAAAGAGAAVNVGDALPFTALPDQHGVSTAVDAAVRTVLFTRDMDGGGLVKDVLAEGGKERLASARAVYVADVSGMPGFVRRTFALPSIRKRPYPVLLDETGEVTRSMPSQEGKATVLTLEAGRISRISFASSTAEVSAALAAP